MTRRSELIDQDHLQRKAIIYVRQSTLQQVLTNHESLALQYALSDRAKELGWTENNIEIIDCDLGISAASAEFRNGFKELITRVNQDEIGMILAYDVTRLSRNCSDWFPLLDICKYRNCLIADRDGVYNPSDANGRLFLGLKGQLSEMELHTIRGRLLAGKLNKAKRGDLGQRLPVGYTREKDGRVTKTANLEVQEKIDLVFATFLSLKTASTTVRHLNQNNILIPRNSEAGDLSWKQANLPSIMHFLKNPTYAGAFVYGKTGPERRPGKKVKGAYKRIPPEKWKFLIHDKYPAYISWETYEKIQAMLIDNFAVYNRIASRGVPRKGQALLQGIAYCGKCGHKMVVQYSGSFTYQCNYMWTHKCLPKCQYVLGEPVEKKIVEAFFDAISPVEVDMYNEATNMHQTEVDKVEFAQGQQLKRLRYDVRLAERQYGQVDPDNRLVASELEKRWETALSTLKNAENDFARAKPNPVASLFTHKMKKQLQHIGEKMSEIWHENYLDYEKKKKLLRALIDKVVLDRQRPESVLVKIIWKGGAFSEFDVFLRIGKLANFEGYKEIEETIVKLFKEGKIDKQIAKDLTRKGHRSPHAETFLPSTVTAIRIKLGLYYGHRKNQGIEIANHLTVSQLAKRLQVPAYWINYKIKSKKIIVEKPENRCYYLFPDSHDTIEKLENLRDGKIAIVNFMEISA